MAIKARSARPGRLPNNTRILAAQFWNIRAESGGYSTTFSSTNASPVGSFSSRQKRLRALRRCQIWWGGYQNRHGEGAQRCESSRLAGSRGKCQEHVVTGGGWGAP